MVNGYEQNKNEHHKTNRLAVASLIMGILFFIPIITQILAIIFGGAALAQIAKKSQEGKGIAIAGLVLGVLFLLMYGIIIFMAFVFAIFLMPYATYVQ